MSIHTDPLKKSLLTNYFAVQRLRLSVPVNELNILVSATNSSLSITDADEIMMNHEIFAFAETLLRNKRICARVIQNR